MIRHPPRSTLFPYTPLFRSRRGPPPSRACPPCRLRRAVLTSNRPRRWRRRRKRQRRLSGGGRASARDFNGPSLHLPTDLARAHAEARRLARLPAGDGRPLERALGVLLDDHPEALQRYLRLAAQPAARAQPLLHGLARRARLAPDRHVHARQALALTRELEQHLAAASVVPPPAGRLDHRPWTLGIDDLRLDPVAVHRRVEPVPRGRGHARRARGLPPVLPARVVG